MINSLINLLTKIQEEIIKEINKFRKKRKRNQESQDLGKSDKSLSQNHSQNIMIIVMIKMIIILIKMLLIK